MNDRQRRRELSHRYVAAASEGGVYRIVNRDTGRFLLGSARDLAGARNRFEFALSTGTSSALDHRLRADAARDGVGVVSFEVLDTIEIRADRIRADSDEDLGTLESLWRERSDPSLLY